MSGSDASVRQTIILAAGVGARLASFETGIPKPLLTVAGLPLVAHALAHAAASGCDEAIVVVGHESDRVKGAIAALAPSITVRFVETPDPSAPNGHSLLAAKDVASSHFFLQMVDHLFADLVLPKLVAAPMNGHAGRVLVDSAPLGIDLSDATRVRLSGERVTAIGKQVSPWDAIDAGCFVLTPAVFDALDAVPSDQPRTVSSAMRLLADKGRLFAVDLAGTRWIDVDTPGDREDAERLLGVVAGRAGTTGP